MNLGLKDRSYYFQILAPLYNELYNDTWIVKENYIVLREDTEKQRSMTYSPDLAPSGQKGKKGQSSHGS